MYLSKVNIFVLVLILKMFYDRKEKVVAWVFVDYVMVIWDVVHFCQHMVLEVYR